MNSMSFATLPTKEVRTRRKSRWKRYGGRLGLYTLLIILAILFLLPFYMMLRNGFMTRRQITSLDWIWLPKSLNMQSFSDLFNEPMVPVLNSFKNSAIIAVSQVVGQLVLASLAGYGLARVMYRWRNVVFYIILGTLMIPTTVTFVPTYVVVAQLGWINTLQGIIVPGLFNVFAVFLFRQFYLDFPCELEEAGRVDGLGHFGIFWYLVIPNSTGIMMSVGSILFINSWNLFLWPLLIGQGPEMWTVQVALSTFITAQTINLPAVFMGAALSVLPPLILFLFLQRYIVEGVRLSGVKG